MRMRRKKHGAERIAACSELLIEHPELLMNDPCAPFSEKKPLALEIGCGKGAFACGTAAAVPEVNMIAMERVADVACLALEKASACADTRPDNLRFIIADASILAECAKPHSVDCIYLNFSDPWPKAKHAKRRLTSPRYLEIYKKLLKKDGAIFFKTDNRPLFDYSVETFTEAGFRLEKLTYDLHSSEYESENLHTEYEDNFSAKGFTINRVEAYVN